MITDVQGVPSPTWAVGPQGWCSTPRVPVPLPGWEGTGDGVVPPPAPAPPPAAGPGTGARSQPQRRPVLLRIQGVKASLSPPEESSIGVHRVRPPHCDQLVPRRPPPCLMASATFFFSRRLLEVRVTPQAPVLLPP